MQVLIVLGSLGVFLFGMRMMSEGLQQAAGPGLQRILAYMTSNRFAGVASGFLITTAIQSSSATTVMVVGFVDASLLTLRQAIGVIMGANIGTTVTAWIVAILGFKFSITSAALPAIAVGTAMLLIKKIRRDDVAHAIIGFGFLFLGLSLLKDAVPDIRNNPEILRFLANYTDLGFLSFLIFVAVGSLLTVVVQSSSAAMAITLTMTFNGWIDYPTAAAIVLGENIGTTVTAYLASLNSGANAKRAARAHLLFNLFGVIWMASLFQPALGLVDALVPGSIASRTEIAAHLAMFHTLFNIANTALCIGFVPYFEKLVHRLVREDEGEEAGSYRLSYVRTGLQETVEINVLTARSELGKMSERVEEVFHYFLELFNNPKKKIARELSEKNEQTFALVQKMQEEITGFLVECSRESIGDQTARNLNNMVRIASKLESIADTSDKLIRLAERRAEKSIKLDDEMLAEIHSYSELVQEFLAFNKRHLLSRLNEEEYEHAEEMEKKLNKHQKRYKKAAQKRLRTGSSVKAELFYLDLIRHLEHLGDFSLEISQALAPEERPVRSA
ncbi:MAG: Na/Pi cotransporter family protein [Spirochaetes bacterium]|jgi:phosphate:Na+ symporter|nr:Na/Pi cotransporter family protein [Spirochaetota bacterium]